MAAERRVQTMVAAVLVLLFVSEARGQQYFDPEAVYSNMIDILKGSYGGPAASAEIADVDDDGEIVSARKWPRIGAGVDVGQVTGVDVDNNGNVYVFHRAERTWEQSSFNSSNFILEEGPIQGDTILKLHPQTGEVLESWGSNMFYMPHGLTVDSEDNVWVTDVGLHQVLKFSAKHRDTPQLVLGTRLTPGKGPHHFCKPTDVAVTEDGAFFVSDGYCNSRVMKFDKDGKLIKEWGKGSGALSVFMGSSVKPNTFNVPHALALAPDHDLICVADRENSRIQCFGAGLKKGSKDCGKFKFEVDDKSVGRVYGLAYHSDGGGILYAVSGNSFVSGSSPAHGLVVSIQSKSVIDIWTPEMGFGEPHAVAVSPQNDALFVGETNPPRVTKFVPRDGVDEETEEQRRPPRVPAM